MSSQSNKNLTMKASVEVPAPFDPADLRAFLSTVPNGARATVIVFEGGNQRDPYPVSYKFTAEWEQA